MKNGVKHLVDVITEERDRINGEFVTKQVKPYVRVMNDDDPYYWQGFETREELEEFIAQLKAAGDQAFGENND